VVCEKEPRLTWQYRGDVVPFWETFGVSCLTLIRRLLLGFSGAKSVELVSWLVLLNSAIQNFGIRGANLISAIAMTEAIKPHFRPYISGH